MFKMRFIFSLAVSVFTLAAMAQSNVSNIRVQTMDHILIIQYDLAARADIEVFASFDGGANFTGPLQHVTGGAGKGIEPGRDKVVIWNVRNEFGAMDNPNVVIKIVSTNEVSVSGTSVEQTIAQEYKPFRVDLGVGWGAGPILNIEPKYAVSPRLNVGLRFEFAQNRRFYDQYRYSPYGYDPYGNPIYYDPYGNPVSYDPYYYPYYDRYYNESVVSCLATVDYHLTQNKFRPFIGGGLGLCINRRNRYFYRNQSNLSIGGVMRAGFDVSHFRFAVSYNFVDKQEFNSNYFGLTIGAYIGGGRRK